MSTVIMSACWPLQGMSPAQKAVLISLADQANDEGVCWPAVKTIATRTCLSERAVQGAIKWLASAGVLVAKERDGRSTVYQITPAAYAPPQEMRGAASARTPAGNAPTPADAAEAPADAAPITINNQQGTVKEPKKSSGARARTISVADLGAHGVGEDVATEFIALRKRKRAPLTGLALAGIKREADGVGWTLDQALRKCIERGWQGFEASWVKDERAQGANKHGNFGKQDYYAGVAADGSF